jgi:hypothetical protein
MITISVKNPKNETTIFNQNIFLSYEITGIDNNYNNIVFLINNKRYTKKSYKDSFLIENVKEGKNKIIYYAINKNNSKLKYTENTLYFNFLNINVPEKTNLSTLIDSTIPIFIQEDYQSFVNFIRKYYKFLEKSNNPFLVPYKQNDFSDVDTTIDYFVLDFYKQFMPDFPENLAVDTVTKSQINKKTLIKNIKKFYDSKGTFDSYRFLFRILFDTKVDIYYPRERIIKASNSDWISKTSIKIYYNDINLTKKLLNKEIYQLDQNNNFIVKAKIKNIEFYSIDQYKIAELFFDYYSGNFDHNKKIQSNVDILGSIENISFDMVQCPSEIEIVTTGYNYRINDFVYLNPVEYVSVDGVLYGQLDFDSWTESELNVGSIDGQVLSEYINTLPENDDNFYQVDGLTFKPFTQDFWTFTSNDFGFNFNIPGEVKTKGKGFVGRVSRVDEKGRILKIDIIDFGFNYEKQARNLYHVKVESQKGKGFEGYVNVNTVCNYPPYFNTDKGRLNTTKILQDNYYYQSHSYELLSEININNYEKNVKKLVHPSGYKLFGKSVVNKSNKANTSIISNVVLT